MSRNPWNAHLPFANHATPVTDWLVKGAAALAVLLVIGAPLALVPPRMSRKEARGLVGAPR